MGEQNAAILSSTGIDETTIKQYVPVYKQIITAIVQAKDSATAAKEALIKINAWAATTDPKILEILGVPDEAARQKYIHSLIPTVYSPWFRYFMSFDPQPYLKKIKCKVLALNGSKDIQVISKSNLAGIRASLKKSKSPGYEARELEGLNHLFQQCKRCTTTEYGELEETFSPEALTIISDWLKKNIK
jgi:hypothetical protein